MVRDKIKCDKGNSNNKVRKKNRLYVTEYYFNSYTWLIEAAKFNIETYADGSSAS